MLEPFATDCEGELITMVGASPSTEREVAGPNGSEPKPTEFFATLAAR